MSSEMITDDDLGGNGHWSDLPVDVMSLIVYRLTSLDDRNSFRIVCSKWSQVSQHYPQLFRSHRIPWLMLPPKILQHQRFYNIEDKKTYTMRVLPDMQSGGRVLGSTPDGWVVRLDASLQVHAYNLMTNKTLRLPSFSTFSCDVEAKHDQDGRITGYDVERQITAYYVEKQGDSGKEMVFCTMDYMYALFFGRATVLPTCMMATQRHAVVLTYGDENRVVIGLDEGQSWKVLRNVTHICDFIVHKGLVFMARGSPGEFIVFDFSSLRKVRQYRFAYQPTDLDPQFRYLYHHPGEHYLFEIEGELWQAFRSYEYEYKQEDEESKTLKVIVIKFDTRKRWWFEKKSIGDYAIFLGSNYPVVVSTKEFPHLEKDCIYFTDDSSWENDNGRPVHFDMGIYNLSDQSLKPYCDESYAQASQFCSPPCWVWMLPNHELQLQPEDMIIN